jgi:opacity protein-like surface antigen
MADSRANIDLVFRNGLKDFEVLPPPGVWENIQPAINVPARRVIFPLFKVAAAVIILGIMSFLSYKLGVEVSTSQLNEMTAINQETYVPEVTADFSPPPIAVLENNKESSSDKTLIKPVEIIAEGSAIATKNLSENAAIDLSGKLMADNRLLPGIQDPFDIKYAKVNQPEFQPITYQGLQDNTEMPAMQRWSVSAIASPTYYSQFSSAGNELASQVIKSDQGRASYTGGVGLAYKISSRFSIQSGLYYSSLGQEVGGVNAYSGFQQYDNSKGDHNFEIITASGTVYTNNSDVFLNSYNLPARVQTYYTSDVFDPVKANLSYVSSTIYQDLSFLEFPVILRYKVLESKVDLNVVGGMSYNFLLNNSVYTENNGIKYPIGTTEGLNAVSLSSSLGMGMEYNLSENLSLNLEPTFRYYINPFNSAKTTGFHPYSIGIFSGLSYKF